MYIYLPFPIMLDVMVTCVECHNFRGHFVFKKGEKGGVLEMGLSTLHVKNIFFVPTTSYLP